MAQASPVLSPADFPALPTTNTEAQSKPSQSLHPHIQPSTKDEKADKIERNAKKKATNAEKIAERERIAQEKAAEKERLAKEKAAEKQRVAKEKAQEKERLAQEKAEKERLAKEEKAEKEKQRKVEKEKVAVGATPGGKGKQYGKASPAVTDSTSSASEAHSKRGAASKAAAAATATEPAQPLPILSKMPKKNKPMTKPIKIPKEDDVHAEPASSLASAVTTNSETPQLPATKLPNVAEVDQNMVADDPENGKQEMKNSLPALKPKSLTELLKQIDIANNGISIEHHPYFDVQKINAASKMPIDYNTMVRALSAFPVSGASYATYATASLNDNTVSSFQQLLETLTQTMSDLVQLLPQSTWGSIFDVLSQDLKDLKREYSLHRSTSFDGLMQDDLPDDVDDEVYEADPPTPSMDKRARWMEVQLAKLEELHRDVNTAAITAILSTNDRGWGTAGFLPRIGNTRARFEQLGYVTEEGTTRPMTIEELEKKLVVAKEAAVFAETELRESIEMLQAMRPRTPEV